MCQRSRQRAGSSEAASHQAAAPRARFNRVDQKIFECAKPLRPGSRPPPGRALGRSASATKSAFGSRSCSRFCPAAAVDTREPDDKLEKAQKMHKFNNFGVISPHHQARWHSRKVPAEHARGSGCGRRSRVIDEVSGRTRTHVDGFGMQQSPRLLCNLPIPERQKARQPLVESPVQSDTAASYVTFSAAWHERCSDLRHASCRPVGTAGQKEAE